MDVPLPSLGLDHIVVPPRPATGLPRRPCSGSYSLGGRQFAALSLRTGSASSRQAKTARPATTGGTHSKIPSSSHSNAKQVATAAGAPPPSGSHPVPGDTASHDGEDGVSWTPEVVGSNTASRTNSRPATGTHTRPTTAPGPHKPARLGSAASIASSQMTALTSLSDTSLDRKLGMASTSRGRKPGLLTTMESHMTRELGILSTGGAEGYGQRLKICRETMGMFMEHFTTYKPILSEIMSEYDQTLADMSKATTDVNKISSQMRHQRRSHEEILAEVLGQQQESEKKYLADFDQLLDVASAADAAKEKTSTAASTLFAEIKRLETQHEEDLEKLKLLAFTIREAEKKNRTLNTKLDGMTQEAAKAKSLRNEIAEKEQEMLELKNTYRETVPKANFVSLQEDFDRKEKYWSLLETKLRRVLAARGSKVESLATLADQLKKERDRLRAKLPKVTTPRPKWDSYDLDDLELTAQFQRADIRAREYDARIGDGLMAQLDGEATTTGQSLDILIPKLMEEDANDDTMITTVELSTTERVTVLMEKIKSMQGTIMELNMALVDATVSAVSAGNHGGGDRASLASTHGASMAASTRGITPSHDPGGQSVNPIGGPLGGGSTQSVGSGGVGVQGHFGFYGTPEDLGDPSKVLLFGRGKGPSVPAYLRHEGVLEVIRQPLSGLVHAISLFFYAAVKLADASALPTGWETQTWLRNYLLETHGEVESIKWGYSIHLGIEQHRHSHAVVTLLAGILEGSLPFRLLNDAVAVVVALQGEAQAVAETQQKKRVRKRDLIEVLWAKMPYKEHKCLEELKLALGKESSVAVDTLLEEKHPFTARLLEQGCQEGMELYSSIVKELAREQVLAEAESSGKGERNESDTSAASGIPEIPAAAVRQAIKNNEPATAASVVIKLSAPVEGKKIEETQNYMIPLHVLIARLSSLPIIRKRRKQNQTTPASATLTSPNTTPGRTSTTIVTGMPKPVGGDTLLSPVPGRPPRK